MIAWFYLAVLVSSVIMTAGILFRNRKVDNAFILFCFRCFVEFFFDCFILCDI